jgi:hypothetical protein
VIPRNRGLPAQSSRAVTALDLFLGKLERAKGIEPSYAAWEAAVLPLNYARKIYQVDQLFNCDFRHAFFRPDLVTGQPHSAP